MATDTLKEVLANHPKYTISDKIIIQSTPSVQTVFDEPEKSWLAIYKPLLTVFAYITGISLLAAWQNGTLKGMQFMQLFMTAVMLFLM